MRLYPIDIRTVRAVQVTRPYRKVTNREIDREKVLHGEFVMEGVELHHSRGIPQIEDLIIRLPVMGGK